MLINLSTVNCQHKNERDLEIPALLNAVKNRLDNIKHLLDVGAHYSHAHYARPLKQILDDRTYTGVDILADDITSQIVDKYYVGNISDLDIQKHDFVSFISCIEHCGLSTYKVNDFRAEQYHIFRRIFSLANKYVLMTFPFGQDHIYPGEYANITTEMLTNFTSIANQQGFHTIEEEFYYNVFAPGGHPYIQIPRDLAADVPMKKEKGTQCVCLSLWECK